MKYIYVTTDKLLDYEDKEKNHGSMKYFFFFFFREKDLLPYIYLDDTSILYIYIYIYIYI
jgi:hypothetical protein